MNTTTQVIAVNPGDVFGYTATFDEALKQIGQISPQEFAKRYASSAEYFHQISYDPTTAKFWDAFNFDAQEHNKNLRLSSAPCRKDRRLGGFKKPIDDTARGDRSSQSPGRLVGRWGGKKYGLAIAKRCCLQQIAFWQ
jgi:hypothetical protein